MESSLEKLLARIRQSTGAERLSPAQLAALEFFGDPRRSLDELSDDELRRRIEAAGGYAAATEMRLAASGLGESDAGGEEAATAEDELDEWSGDASSVGATGRGPASRGTLVDPALEARFPGELGELAGRIASYALFRQMMSVPNASVRTTHAFLQDQLATRETRQCLAAAACSGERFVEQIADSLVELLIDVLEQQIRELEQTGEVRHARELLDSLRKLPAALATVSAIDRRAFCLHQFLELSEADVAAQLGVAVEQVPEHLRRATAAVESAL